MSATNRQLRLAARPTGEPTAENWNIREEPVEDPKDGQFLVEISHVSLDPAMRGWMNEGRSYIEPVALGAVMRAGAVGRVVDSAHPAFAEGEYVVGALGVQQYAVSDGTGVEKIDLDLAPPETYLGTLGLTGLTAYFGLLDVGKCSEGDTVVVSGAAGAVGSVVGQIAKIKNCRVIGIAGGPEKCRWITEELGFDAAIDYKSDDVTMALRTHVPERLNVFFDNVGGDILDAALTRLARGARIVICGAISQYNATQVRGPANYMALLVDRASMTGMIVFDFAARYGEARRQLGEWLKSGQLVSREQVVTGTVDDFPETLLKLFRGENMGKLVLALKEPGKGPTPSANPA